MSASKRDRSLAAMVAFALVVQACPYRYYPTETPMLQALSERPIGVRLRLRDGTHVVVREPTVSGGSLIGRPGRCSGPSCGLWRESVNIPLADLTRFEVRESEDSRATRTILGGIGLTIAGALSTFLIVALTYCSNENCSVSLR